MQVYYMGFAGFPCAKKALNMHQLEFRWVLTVWCSSKFDSLPIHNFGSPPNMKLLQGM